jgi:hypothetical protein
VIIKGAAASAAGAPTELLSRGQPPKP